MLINKADHIFKENIQDILDFGCWDENPRPKYESDGKPAHSIYITQVFEKYNLQRGELPITTLRPIGIRGAINELLAIYQTQTNSQEGFESHNVVWWLPWMNESGDLGRAYSYNLESHRPNEMTKEIVKVKRVVLNESEYTPKEIGLINEIQDSIDEKIYESKYRGYGRYIIIDEYTDDSRVFCKVQFLNNGYITNVRKDSLSRGQHPKNNFIRTLNDIGYLGDYRNVGNFTDENIKILYGIWQKMITRCYGGAKKWYEEVYVSSRWHSFENFLRDVRYLPQYHLAKDDDFNSWHLDKDYFGSNCYSKETCVFLTTRDNTIYRNTQAKPLEIITKDEKFTELTHTSLANKLSVGKSTIGRWIKNGSNHNGDIIIKEMEIENDYLYRYELSRNQINELIYGLKNDKYSRRHMLSFFNWSNQDKKMLVECAFQSLFSVRNVKNEDYLDLTLTMRSSDYLALQMMIAHECNMKVGNFARFTQNLHIYSRHVEQAHELLKRKPSTETPSLILNAEGKSFYEITVDDFELINYNPVKPQMKFDLGI
jgi:thymidylate synthase